MNAENFGFFSAQQERVMDENPGISCPDKIAKLVLANIGVTLQDREYRTFVSDLAHSNQDLTEHIDERKEVI